MRNILPSGSPPRIGQSSGRPDGATLEPRHLEYLRARGVSRKTAEAAGCYSAARPSEIPAGFSSWQRRQSPALVVPHRSPDGEAMGWQTHPDHAPKNAKGKPIKWMSPKGARLVLATHPRTVEAVRRGTGRLWMPEGYTRMLGLTERDEVAVSYGGADAWKQDKKPLRCFDHINFAGRLVLDTPDADYRVKEGVQRALAERVAFLESRGARVLVVSVPPVNGDPGAGLDDYLAAGGDLEALVRAARPFAPSDVGAERLDRDERLRRGVTVLRRNADALDSRKARECSALAVARYMHETSAPQHGKPLPDGVEVRPSFRQIAEAVRVGVGTVSRAMDHLEAEAGFLKTLEPARGVRPASYLLLYDPPRGGSEVAEHIEERGAGGKEVKEKGANAQNGQTPHHQRDSSSSVPQPRGGGGRPESVPALRNSKVVHTYERRGGERVVVHSDFYKRYCKKREAIIRHVLEWGGADEAELLERFGSKTARARDFRRTWLGPMLADGVLVLEGATVAAAPDWLAAVERVKERTDEDGDTRRQRENYRRQRASYRERLAGEAAGTVAKPEPEPELVGDKERVRETVARAAARDAERVAEERREEIAPAVAFVRRTFAGLDVARLGLLEDLWGEEKGLSWHLRRALRETGCTAKRHEEHPGEWFVYPPDEWPDPGSDGRSAKNAREADGAADVVRLRRPSTATAAPENLKKPETPGPADSAGRPGTGDPGVLKDVEPAPPRKMPPKGVSKNAGGADGIWIHGPECDCWICGDEEPVESTELGIGASA